MVKQALRISAIFLALILSSAGTLAQPQARGSGHWEGTLQAPGQELTIVFDLARSGEKWEGTMSVPEQKVTGLPLSAASVEGDTVKLAVKLPGNPQFTGTLSADGQSLSGDFTQGGASTPLALKRTGDAKIEPPAKSTPITSGLEGSWEGTLDVKGTLLRLVLKLSNQADGVATGVLVSVDQGGAEIPISTIVQTGTQLKLRLPAIAGAYEGALQNGQLTGTWTQGPLTLPLVFKRSK